MIRPGHLLPDGFVVRLHDHVAIGTHLVSGNRVLKLSAAARRLLTGRTLTVDSPISAILADRLLDLDLVDPVLEAGDTEPGDLSVVIPVRDNPTGVARLLALLGSTLPCIVVDDASGDPEALAKVVADHGARLIRLDHNMGPAAARNVGLREVSTTFVAFVDSDVTISPLSLIDLIRHFTDPWLAAVAPRITAPNGRRWFQHYEAACGSLDLGPDAATLRQWSRLTYVPSACLVARVDALGAGFDPSLRSGEDVDLVWRLQAGGQRVRYAAEVPAHHDSRTTVSSWLGRKAFYGTSAAPLAVRHGDRVAPAMLTPSVLAIGVGLLVQRRWSLVLAGMGAAAFARETTTGLDGLASRQKATIVATTGSSMARQVSGLALRHWWPVSLLLALVSSRARRALLAMAVLDGLVAHRSTSTELDPVRFTLARRADDLAYGAGIWWGAARARSAACLLPRWISPRRRAGGR